MPSGVGFAYRFGLSWPLRVEREEGKDTDRSCRPEDEFVHLHLKKLINDISLNMVDAVCKCDSKAWSTDFGSGHHGIRRDPMEDLTSDHKLERVGTIEYQPVDMFDKCFVA